MGARELSKCLDAREGLGFSKPPALALQSPGLPSLAVGGDSDGDSGV